MQAYPLTPYSHNENMVSSPSRPRQGNRFQVAIFVEVPISIGIIGNKLAQVMLVSLSRAN
jgi:hypothetical protein